MSIYMSIRDLIGEATEYDKKLELEIKKPKSWCKSVSAFANTLGGKLIFGIADEGQMIGLENPEQDAEKISEIIKTRLDPIPEFKLSFHSVENGKILIILDIFAKRAFTREGKIQVELAQLKYRASKLTGQGKALSRLGGGIGTRGPGEKKLEMDRRLIRTRISRLKAELRDVVKHREVQRKQRQKNHLPVVCIVGYTNAGKSTLLNHFTNAGVYEEDQLFATLDPTTKSLDLSGGQTILMTDTVGFIRKLPHHLVEAFKSTLEEAKYSDLILHVVDASNPQKEKQMEAVYETLKQLGANESPIVTAFNKIDLLNGDEILKDQNAEAVVRISGKTGEGTDQLLENIEKILQKQKLYLEKLYDYQDAGKIQQIRAHGQLLKEEYREDGIYVEAYIPKEILGNI